MNDSIHIADNEEPIHVSREGVELYDRGESVLLSTESLRDSPGPDGLLISIDEFVSLAVDIRELTDE